MSDFRALNSTTVAICCSIRCYLSHSRIRVLEVLVPLKVGSCAHVAKARQLDSSKCLRMTHDRGRAFMAPFVRRTAVLVSCKLQRTHVHASAALFMICDDPAGSVGLRPSVSCCVGAAVLCCVRAQSRAGRVASGNAISLHIGFIFMWPWRRHSLDPT